MRSTAPTMNGPARARARRVRAAGDLWDRGASVERIAARLGVSIATTWEYVNEHVTAGGRSAGANSGPPRRAEHRAGPDHQHERACRWLGRMVTHRAPSRR